MTLKIQETYPYHAAYMHVNKPAHVPASVFGNNQPAKPTSNNVDRLDLTQKALYAGGIIPTVRRIGSLPGSIENEDWIRAGSLLGIAAANFPGDFREIARAGGEFKNLVTKGVLPSAKNYAGQHAMTLLDGTFLEKLKNIPLLNNLDKALYDTKFGQFLQRTFKLGFDPKNINEIKIHGLKMGGKQIIADRTVLGVNFNGNYAQRLLGKSLMRVSLLGVAVTSLLEVPALVKSITKTEGNAIDKAKAFGKQLIKSAGYVTLVTAGIIFAGGMFGATALGSLAGMAVGSAIGIMASKGVNNLVDKYLEKDTKKQEQKNPFIPAYTA